jgi:hypothetical protein
VTEVVPLGGGFIECSEVRHGLCFDALQVNHGTIVSASALGGPVLTSTSDVNGAGRQRSQAARHGQRGQATPRQCHAVIELLAVVSEAVDYLWTRPT